MISTVVKKFNESLDNFRLRILARHRQPIPFTFRGRRYFLNPDKSASYHIKHSTSKLARMVECVDGSPRVIFDVGANCGIFSALCSQRFPESDIYAFEPSPSLLPIIKMNASKRNISILDVAVGEKDEARTLYINRSSEQTNSLNKDAVLAFQDDAEIKHLSVQCRSLDSFVAENKISKVDVLKVDVQGFEGAVFRGAKDILSKVEWLFVESTWMDIESISQVIPLAVRHGFTNAAVVNPVYMGSDLVFTRRPLTDPTLAQFSFNLAGIPESGLWF